KKVRGRICTSTIVKSISRDGSRWIVNGERKYHALVSTLPVHELLSVWSDAPKEARDAAGRLRYNSLINVLLGMKSKADHEYTAVYIPDAAILFHRISFPQSFSPRNVPPGGSSVMAEITANEGDGTWEMADERIVARTID